MPSSSLTTCFALSAYLSGWTIARMCAPVAARLRSMSAWSSASSAAVSRTSAGELRQKSRREEEQTDKHRDNRSEEDARSGDVLRGLGRWMPLRRRQADGELERGVDPLEAEDEGDGQQEYRPFDVGDSEPRREKHRCDRHNELDPGIALRAKDVRDALERIAEGTHHLRRLGPGFDGLPLRGGKGLVLVERLRSQRWDGTDKHEYSVEVAREGDLHCPVHQILELLRRIHDIWIVEIGHHLDGVSTWDRSRDRVADRREVLETLRGLLVRSAFRDDPAHQRKQLRVELQGGLLLLSIGQRKREPHLTRRQCSSARQIRNREASHSSCARHRDPGGRQRRASDKPRELPSAWRD